MRRLIACATVVATATLLALGARAAELAAKLFTCPLDGTKLEGKTVVSTNSNGGVDSDFCQWPTGGMSLTWEVQVCPKDFYSARTDTFESPLPDATKKDLQAALAKWRGDHPDVKSIDDVTPGRRWELTAICGIVKKHPVGVVGNYWLRAAWAARQWGLADCKYTFADPMSAFEMLDEADRTVKAAKSETKKANELLQFAMGCQRVGDVLPRDVAVAQLEKMKLDEKQSARLASLKKEFVEEASCQEKAIAGFTEAVEKELAPAEERDVYLFLIADMTRRLGKSTESVALYKKVLAAGKIRKDIRELSTYFINRLGSEP